MDSLLLRLALALAIGLLVGLERGWRERDAPDRSRTAGIRTYGLSGLLGGVVAALAQAAGSPALLATGFVAFAAIFAWFKLREATHDGDFSVTAVVAGMAVFALGALSVVGDQLAAAAGGTALAAVLASREGLHGLLRKLTWPELRSALVLAVMTVIVLPVLPDRTIDPWGGVNLHEIWLFTVLVAGISFAGYIAVRIAGERSGLLVGAVAGAIVSSTAVTVSLARTAKNGGPSSPLAGAASFAATVSVLRVGLVVTVIEPSVFAAIAPPILVSAVILASAGWFLLARGEAAIIDPAARNPFDLPPLLGFAVLLAVVSALSAALSDLFAGRGVLVTSAMSGMFDVDVAVLSALRLGDSGFAPDMMARAVLLALVSNAVGRLFLAMLAGPVRFWLPLAGIAVAAFGAAGAAFVLLPPLPIPG